MSQTAVCYKTKTGDMFLFYQSYKSIAELQEECDKLNSDKPEKTRHGRINWDKVDYFFPNEQKHIDTRDCSSYWPGGD